VSLVSNPFFLFSAVPLPQISWLKHDLLTGCQSLSALDIFQQTLLSV